MSQREVIPVSYRPPFAVGRRPWHDERPEGESVLDIVRSVPDLPRDFLKRGIVLINGEAVPRELWSYVRPRPASKELPITVTLHWPLGNPGGGGGSTGKSIIALVAALALIVVTAGIATFGVAALGIAGGSFGALALAGAVGLVGSLAISMLTAPPAVQTPATQLGDTANLDNKDPAGAQGNVLVPGGPVPRVVGTRKVYPPFCCEPVVEMINGDEYVEAIFALNGPHTLDDIRIDGVSVTDMDDVEIQTRDGVSSDTALDLVTRQGKTSTPQLTLSEHKLGPDDQSLLSGGTTPTASDLPIWHRVVTRFSPDKVWLHLVLPGGIADANTGTNILAFPFRIRMRRLGDSSWYNFPEFHYTNQTTRQVRLAIVFKWDESWGGWNSINATRSFYRAHRDVPVQTSSPAGSGWTADGYFDDGSGNDYVSAGNEGSTRIRRMRMFQDYVEFYVGEDGTFDPSGNAFEIEIIKGSAYIPSRLAISTYKYSTLSATVVDFFWAYLRSGVVMTPEDQTGFVHQVALVRVVTIWDQHPVAGGQGKFALIAIKARNRNVQRLSVLAGGLVNRWGGSDWDDFGASSNPADHYYNVLVDQDIGLNLDPLETSLVDNDGLVEWRNMCDDFQWLCDAIIDDMRTQDVLSLLASCGYARPYQSDQYGVTVDKDVSGDSPVQVFSRLNTVNMKFEKAFAKVPQGFIVTYHDNNSDNDNQQIVVYQRDTSIAPDGLLESVTYDGLTFGDAVIARAQFDLDQGNLRSTFYSFDTDIESLVCRRGSLVALQHDVLATRTGDARIKAYDVSSFIITRLYLDSLIPVINDGPSRTGIAIRHTDGSITTHLVDGSVATGEWDVIDLDTGPFDDGSVVAFDDSGEKYGSMIVSGDLDSEYKRMLVLSITATKDLKASVVLVDEAPDLVRPDFS